MNKMSQKPRNFSRVMLSSGETLTFATYIDGMYISDESERYFTASEFDGWLSIEEVKSKLNITSPISV